MISDIDECKAETMHNCSLNAFCNNTESSYKCTCEPGYLGDGWYCKGNCYYMKQFLVDWDRIMLSVSLFARA